MTDDNYRTIIKHQQEQYERMLTGKIPIVAKKETVALKPCPFCGGKPIEDWEREEREGDKVGRIINWSVYCTKCYAEVFSCQSREDAQAKWNRRASE